MINSYLKKYYNELNDEKENLLRNRKKNILLLNENDKLISIIMKSEDKNFESFVPGNLFEKDKTKLLELEENQKYLKMKEEAIRNDISKIDYKIIELSEIIKLSEEEDNENEVLRSKFIDCKDYYLKLLKIQDYKLDNVQEKVNYLTEQIENLENKISMCSKIIDMDISRCKLELQGISKLYNKILLESKKFDLLNDMFLYEKNLESALKKVILNFNNSNLVNIVYSTKGENCTDILPVIFNTIIRIIYMICDNAINKRNARNIKIFSSCNLHKNEIVLELENDGIGFDSLELLKDGINLQSDIDLVLNLINLLSGKYEIIRKENGINIIHIWLPIKCFD